MRSHPREILRLGRHILPVRRFPTHVFLVGAQKSGTTSLHSYLTNHPMVVGGDRKELHFFDLDVAYERGITSYMRMFPVLTAATHALDASPSYFYRLAAPKRIHAFCPDAKIIVVLREPAARAFSAFNHYSQSLRTGKSFRLRIKSGRGDPSFRAFLTPFIDENRQPTIHHFLDHELATIAGNETGEEPALIRRGIYAPQLDRYVRLFGRENIHVLFSSDLKRDPRRVTNEVFRFLGLEPLSGVEYPFQHVRSYTVDTAGMETIRSCAKHLFEQDKQELLDRHGIQVPW